MSEKVTQVARAISDAFTGRLSQNYHPFQSSLSPEAAEMLARVAIEAMRQPTGKMLDMGQHFYDKTEGGLMDIDPDDALHEAWDRMISVALEP